ncbi:MAG TPA: hypothetical protein VNP36_11325 [Burkholderiales bacterium]|nr:hypothetical protein [Burkholderiales bacterium]
MKKAPLFAAFSLLFAPGLGMSQAPQPAPAEEPPASRLASPAASPGPRLNLKLDNPAQYSREMPKDSGSAERLPSLGGDARSLPARDPTASRNAVYPQDSNPNR